MQRAAGSAHINEYKMKLTKQLKAEILKLYHSYWDAYLKGDIKTFTSYFDGAITIFGTAKGEIFTNKKAAEKFYKATAHQMSGKAEMRKRKIALKVTGTSVLIYEQFDLYVLAQKEWMLYGHVRMTSMVEQKGGSWKVVLQHASFPDIRADEGEQIATQKIKAENIQLKEAVQRRTIELENKSRELEIEASLERVRAVAMGMQKADDMLSICKTISQQLAKLGVKEIRNVQTAIFYESRGTYINYEYYAKHDRTFITDVDFKNHKLHLGFAKKMIKGPNEEVLEQLKGKKMQDWYAYQKTTNQFADKYILKAHSLNYYWYSLGPVALGTSTYYPLTKEETDLFKRFLKVFELAYRRYLDIEKATAQAKEAEIELALERVRARTMAMQKSEELPEAANVLFQQVQTLGMPAWSAGYCIWNDNKSAVTLWMSSEGVLQPPFTAPTTKDELFIEMRKGQEAGNTFHVVEMGGKKLEKHYEYMRTLPVVGEILDSIINAGHPLPIFQIMHHAYFSKGFLLFITYEPVPDAHDIFKRFGKVFDQTYTRFLDLQKAEAQAKEAQIETALERVRSRSMAMHTSKELKDVIQVVYEQFIQLNINIEHTGFIINYKERNDMHIWLADQYATPFEIAIPYFDSPHWNSFNNARKKGKNFFANRLNFEEKNKFYTDLFKLIPPLPAEAQQTIFNKPGLAISTVLLDTVGLYIENFSGTPYTDAENATLMRFGKVFQQTYTRFNDLQKAEAQAKEAQIEAALEKVRSRSLAMHKSNELSELVNVLYEKLNDLGITSDGININIIEEGTKNFESWLSAPGLNTALCFHVPYFRHPVTEEIYAAHDSGSILLTRVYSYDEKQSFFNYLYTNTDFRLLPDERKQQVLVSKNWEVSIAFVRNIALSLHSYSGKIFSDAENEVLKRFAKVFEQTYTRFLDLQKAEAQAKEAEIELGLERVRARAMAMQKSDELSELVDTVFKELTKLDFALNWCIINIIDAPSLTNMVWAANPETNKPPESYLMKFEDFPFHHSMMKGYQERKPKHVYVLEGKEKKTYDDYLFNKTEWRRVPKAAQAASRAMKRYVATFTFSNFGGLQTVGEEYLSEENLDILSRFGKVFDLTYTRFNDLQKAEAQAKEAQIETALEKVRSRTMAMQSSNELQETAAVLFNEFKKLGTDNIYQVTIGIYNEEEGVIDFRSTSWADDGAQDNRSFSLTMEEPTVIKPAVTAWKANKKSLVIDLSGEALEGWLNYRNKISGITKMSTDTDGRRVITAAYYSKGHLSISTPVPVPADTLRTLERFAAVFDSTYTRFLDLKKAEAQALRAEQDLIEIKVARQKAEDALTELQATQKQLIQSEKMASLGELTAGIAHEIQNPLNFVNNFSEVSTELVDEMNEEIAKGNLEDAAAIASDLKQNLEKINHHGKRAGDIVKGMLQHSRSSSATKEPTDINKLADEYLRLAYHGLRAKDKSFNATMKTDYDESIGNINIIPQDIGRVILNLITNAFYVVNEKKTLRQAQGDNSYEPTVSVSTKKVGDKVEIKVADNGNGIPQKILDKIFQPFFTTKPTGQGTGLGLSLSYDIVKAHGGELKVETKEGEGSEFIIHLPV